MTTGGTNPTFLIVGAMKAGTTSLYEALLRHPDVYMSPTKELDALLGDEVETPSGLAQYQRHFSRGRGAMAVGEASPNYTKRHLADGVAERARRVLGPELAVVYVVRDPLARLVSHVNHHRLAGHPFDPAEPVGASSGFVQTSRYHYQIEPWLESFGEQRVLVLDLADLVGEPASALDVVVRHLGLDPGRGPREVAHTHASAGKRIEGPRLRRYVTHASWYTGWVRGRVPGAVRRRLRTVMVRPSTLPMLDAADLRIPEEVYALFDEELRRLEQATGVRVACGAARPALRHQADGGAAQAGGPAHQAPPRHPHSGPRQAV